MHNPLTQRLGWWRPGSRSREGLEKINGGGKEDICNTFNNKDFFKSHSLWSKKCKKKEKGKSLFILPAFLKLKHLDTQAQDPKDSHRRGMPWRWGMTTGGWTCSLGIETTNWTWSLGTAVHTLTIEAIILWPRIGFLCYLKIIIDLKMWNFINCHGCL